MQNTNGSIPSKVAERLRENEVHVWRLRRKPSEGRGPLHTVLAGYLGIDAGQVILIEDTHGRPSLAPHHASTLGFNWSHSGEYALLAIARSLSPGIDVETRRERPRALDIAQRYFSTEEAAWLATLQGQARSTAFLELWTARESVLKALGRGLAFGLQRLTIGSDIHGLTLLRLDGGDVVEWQLHRLDAGDDVIAALAWHGPPRQIHQFTLADTA